MSYDFTVAGSEMGGTFTTALTLPITIAAWIKYANHPEGFDWITTLHVDAVNNGYISLKTNSVIDRIDAVQSADDASGSSNAIRTSGVGEYDGVWVPLVGTFESITLYNLFVELITNKGIQTTSRDPGTMGVISIGDAPNGNAHFVHHIAEVAIWDGTLLDADVTRYLAGEPASDIDASNLSGYWPFDTDRDTAGTYLNAGTDASGDLTITNAIYDIDHPPITGDAVEQLSMGGIIVLP